MTKSEAIAASFDKPLVFVAGQGGVDGYYGRVVFQGEVRQVLYKGQWHFDTREQALKATRVRAQIMQHEAGA